MRHDRDDAMSVRQFSVLLWASLVSPLIRQVPGAMALIAREGVWLSAMLTFPAAPALGLLWARFLRSRQDGEGLGELFCRCVGCLPGRAAAGLCAVWISFYAGFALRAGADRFVAAVYPESPVWLFGGVMLLLSLGAALGRAKTLSRCAQLIAPVLAAVFALVLVFCLPNMEAANLWPLPPDAFPRACRGALPLINTLSVGVLSLFLAGRVEKGDLRAAFSLPLLSLSLLGALLCAATGGTFGADLADKMNYPFFVMIRSVRIAHLLERVEALVVAQWVAADFLLLSLLLHSASMAAQLALFGYGAERKGLSVWLCAAVMALGAVLCAPTAFALRRAAREIIPLGNAVVAFLLIPAIFLIGRLRKKL